MAPLATIALALGPVLLLRDRYYIFPTPVLIGSAILGGALIVAVAFAGSDGLKRVLLGGFTAMLFALNVVAVVALFGIIFSAGNSLRGGSLLLSAADCWLVNVATFALVFWYLSEVLPAKADPPGLLFPGAGDTGEPHNIVDYIFVAATTALAFGPTDTPPATTSMRFVMLTEAMISFIIVAVVAARALNAIQ